MYVLAQIVGLIASGFSIACFQLKKETHILIAQFITNLLMALNFGLLGGFSGAWVCLVAAVVTILMFFVNKKASSRKHQIKIALLILFFAIFIIGGFITYKSWPDIIVCICALLFTLSVSQENASEIRSIMLFNSCLWIVYDIALGAWTTIILHGLTLSSIIIGMIRLDRKARNEKVSEL